MMDICRRFTIFRIWKRHSRYERTGGWSWPRYLPDLHPRSAHRKLQHWITIYPGLPGRLLSLGYHEGERVYSPAMVRAIIESLGEP